MNDGFSFTRIVLDASGLVQIILLLLMVASVLSWAVIAAKRGRLGRTQRAANKFEDRFWSGGTLTELYESLRHGKGGDDGLGPIFKAGYEEFARQQQHGSVKVGADEALAAVQRQMRVAQAREIEKLEGGLSLLATIGSTSPYVGLFGTVWGIMHAFIAIGNAKQATLAMVAPGIAEALIATAMGLFAAIPAVVAYNFFTARVDRLEGRYTTFAEELTGIIERGLRSVGAARNA
ncbi:MAG: protein TolQ [Gammaproteobacteria bacterium]|nr:protein TolQ [Gammaproteobacteria bacterium]